MQLGAHKQVHRNHRVWRAPLQIRYTDALSGINGFVAPILAGFSLTSVAILSTSRTGPPLATWAVFSFTTAAVALVYSVEWAYKSVQHSATPEERKAWHPEMGYVREALDYERQIQAKDRELQRRHARLGVSAYNLGLFFFLIGLFLMLVPDSGDLFAWPPTVRVEVIIPLIVVLVATLLHVFASQWDRPRALFPSYKDLDLDAIRVEPIDDEAWEHLRDHPNSDQRREASEPFHCDLRRVCKRLAAFALLIWALRAATSLSRRQTKPLTTHQTTMANERAVEYHTDRKTL